MNLKNKIIIITGGTQGIGLATANLFAKNGAKVIVCSRHSHNLPIKHNISFMKVDISDFQSCKKMVEKIIKKHKKIDVLVNNAGITRDNLTINMTDSDFNSVIQTNLLGTFNMTKSVIKYMNKQKFGSIVNISSCVALTGNIGQANYVASKSGIEGMTKTWAKEFARHGENIRVNAVAPGAIQTNMLEKVPEKIIETFKQKSMLKRLATKDEIANVIMFLASDESSCITGTIIHADCGCRM